MISAGNAIPAAAVDNDCVSLVSYVVGVYSRAFIIMISYLLYLYIFNG